MKEVYNFSAGPAVLPKEVLKEAADEMLSYKNSGLRQIFILSHGAELYRKITDMAVLNQVSRRFLHRQKLHRCVALLRFKAA